jgi:hypothetical protein
MNVNGPVSTGRIGWMTWLVWFVTTIPAQSASAQTSSAPRDPAIQVSTVPEHPLIERTHRGQALNFDFRFAYHGSGAGLELREVTMRALDAGGAVIGIVELNDNGIAPGIRTIPNRKLSSDAGLTVFNPFHTLAPDWPIATLEYEFFFKAGADHEVSQRIRVEPRAYTTKTRLRLPLDGRVLVWDGHDYYSHHRRLDLDSAVAREFGIRTNAGRYSYDLVIVDDAGRRFSGDESKSASHFTYGRPVLAPGDGVVVAAVDGIAEGEQASKDAIHKDPMIVFGNHVVIDHGNGEFSHIGHMKTNSLRVKVGDKVRAGQVIGAAGTSGSSLFPHVHYELATGKDLGSEGLPSQFVEFDRILGARRVKADGTSPDSGDIIEARER